MDGASKKEIWYALESGWKEADRRDGLCLFVHTKRHTQTLCQKLYVHPIHNNYVLDSNKTKLQYVTINFKETLV